MNYEIEAYPGELRTLRRIAENCAYPPVQIVNNISDEELDGLRQLCSNQQQKIHAMTLTCAGQETRLRAISKIADQMFRHKKS